MSMFYCKYHFRVEDSDEVGIEIVDGDEMCEEGAEMWLDEKAEEEEAEEEQ